jgi:hypothetical protein
MTDYGKNLDLLVGCRTKSDGRMLDLRRHANGRFQNIPNLEHVPEGWRLASRGESDPLLALPAIA